MIEQTEVTHSPVCSAVGYFVAGCLVLGLIAICVSSGLLTEDLSRRGMYIVLGVMMMLVGNALPKLRPFARWRAEARRAETIAGVAIMLAGATWIAAFAVPPTEWVRWVAVAAALAAFLVIVGCTSVVLFRASFKPRSRVEPLSSSTGARA